MANEFVIKVTLSDDGSGKKTVQSVRQVSGALNEVERAHKRASKEADTHFHKQDKGIIGTANNARSFSKLAQTINGDNNSLVGAYAALAANIFAVSAAFLALKNAAETAQVIEGLAASGARLGLSYKNAMVEVRDAADGLLSLEQSARSTAQVLSAGFNTEQLVRLTNAAQDTSFALGRDMQESMDRLTRGVIKLEPELLDELGIMVRLDEASSAYARSIGKATSELTAAEKRQGFYNATIAEAEAKFGGLSDGANNAATGLNKLNATFNDLSKTVLNLANFALGGLVNLLGSSQGALLGGILLFISSIKGQLIPALTGAAEQAKKLSVESSKLAGVAAKDIINNSNWGKDGSESVNKYFKEVEHGRGTLEQTRAEQEKLNNAIIIGKKDQSITGSQSLAYQHQLDGLKKIEAAQLNTSALQSAANSTIEASQGKVGQSMKHVVIAAKEYNTSIKLATTSTSLFSTTARVASVSAFFLGTAIKSIGVAILTILPWLGLITIAINLAWSGLKMLAGEGFAKATAATKAYSETLKTTKEAAEQYNKLTESTASAFTIVSSKAIIAGNSVSELTTKLREMREAQDKDDSFLGKTVRFFKDVARNSDATTIAQRMNPKFNTSGPKAQGAQVSEILDNYELIKTFEQLSKFESAQGIIKKIFGEDGPNTVDEVRQAVILLEKKFKNLASVIEEVQSSFKALESASVDFIKAITPSTPYDAMTTGLQATTTAMSKYVDEVGKGTQSTADLASILSGIGPSTEQFLSLDSSRALNKYREISAEIQTIKSLGKDASKIEKDRLVTLTASLSGMQKQNVSILSDLDSQREIFETMQRQNIEQQGRLTLAQAWLATVNKSNSVTAAGVKQKIDAENTVISLQITQLNSQATILRGLIEQNEQKQKLIDKEKELIGLGDVLNEQARLRSNEARILALSNSNDFFAAGNIEILTLQNEKLRESIALKQSAAKTEAAITNIQNQVAAASLALISEAESKARQLVATREAGVFLSKQEMDIAQILLSYEQKYSENRLSLYGINTRLATLNTAEVKIFDNKIKLAKEESALKQAQYALQAEQTKSEADRAVFLSREADERDRILPAILTQLELERNSVIIKNLQVKSAEDRLRQEQKVLDILKSQKELSQSAATAEASLTEIRARTKAKSEGRELTSTEERALAVDKAQLEYNNALAVQSLKMSVIDAEYALLRLQMSNEQRHLANLVQSQEASLLGNAIFYDENPRIKEAAQKEIAANKEAISAYSTVLDAIDASQMSARALVRLDIEKYRLILDEAKAMASLSGSARTFGATSTVAKNGLPDQDGQTIGGLGFNKETILALSEDLSPFIEDLKKLGPQGEYVSAVVEGALIIADSFRRIGEAGLTSSEGLAAVGSIIGQVAKIAQSSAQAKIAAVDQEIAAEQKRDGKSSESVARIQAMEKKKDAMAKKAFEVNKKLMIAQAIVSTASGMMGALSTTNGFDFPIRLAMAAMIGAMGAAQIGIIAGTSYQSSSSAASVATPSAVSVGKRSDSVNLARNNSTPGGELGYLTGAQGTGTNSSNFRPRAYGGYGHAGMIVGEKGPEVFTPSVPGQITSNDKVSGQQAVPVNFHINAIDAEGVEQVLTNQRGHIIGMLREAANANGQTFLENVDTAKYARRGGRRL